MGLLQGILDYESHQKALDDLVRHYRPQLSQIAREGATAIEQAVPDYVRPHDPRYAEVVQQAAEYAIGHWFDMVADPALESDEVIDFFRELGVGEAREGRSLESWQRSARAGTSAAIAYITRRDQQAPPEVPGELVGQITASVLAYIDRLAEAVAAGHAEANAREIGEYQGRRRRLLELLIAGPEPDLKEIRDLAAKAEWALPQAIAVVAVRERAGLTVRRPALPSEVLMGLHLDDPCLVVPDPEGPGRRRMLEHGLSEWTAVVGPTVPLTSAVRSLDWARRGLELTRRGHIPGDRLVLAVEHLPSLMILDRPDLLCQVAERRLERLLELRPRQRRVLAETLLACLESGFNATEVAQRLHMHAQTIRYRVRQLEGLLGEGIYDPAGRLELHMVLHGWLALHPESAEERTGPVRTG
ncbi:helix-turn-helix domain-containing protein [Actinocorallia aurantiaca]|uniref:PucR family transcriptional regulator n=1 Tax=Actinocorallia aurantiaca TaxID=46204 RepID=A0ABN3UGR1_9ACTN